MQTGEKLANAYIYAIASDSADVDSEIFNIKRLESIEEKPFEVFSPALSFSGHDSSVFHQNYLTRKSGIVK